MYSFLLKILTPFIKLVGKVHMPFSRKRVTGKDYFAIRDKIEVGTVFLTSIRGELSNLFNPCVIKHAGIYVGRVKDVPTVAEATGKGVVYTDLVTFLTTKDYIVGTAPLFLTEDDKEQVVDQSEIRLNVPYDYLFKDKNKAFYCFELVADIFQTIKPSVILNTTEIKEGFKIYDHSAFLDDKRFIKLFELGAK